MKASLLLTSLVAATALTFAGGRALPAAEDPLIEGFRQAEVASVADAIEQLYGRQAYMHHDMRAVFKTKFAGPAVTVLLKKQEHKEGSAASQGMIEAIDTSPAGSVYVLVLEDGLDYGAVGGLMATTMKVRGFAGAIVDASIRDLPQIQRIQFPIYSRGVSPGTTVGHYRSVGRQHSRDLCGRDRPAEGHHHRGRRRRGRRAVRDGGGGPEEGPGPGPHGTLDVPVHRTVQVADGSDREVRPSLGSS